MVMLTTKDEKNFKKHWNGREWCVIATRSLARGATLFQLEGEIRSRPDRYTLQIGDDMHIDCKSLRYSNHHCEPSSVYIHSDRSLRACRDIEKGDEIQRHQIDQLARHPIEAALNGAP